MLYNHLSCYSFNFYTNKEVASSSPPMNPASKSNKNKNDCCMDNCYTALKKQNFLTYKTQIWEMNKIDNSNSNNRKKEGLCALWGSWERVWRPLNIAASIESGSRCVSVSVVVQNFLPPANDKIKIKIKTKIKKCSVERKEKIKLIEWTYVETNHGTAIGLKLLHCCFLFMLDCSPDILQFWFHGVAKIHYVIFLLIIKIKNYFNKSNNWNWNYFNKS